MCRRETSQKNKVIILKSKVRDRISLAWPKSELQGINPKSGSPILPHPPYPHIKPISFSMLFSFLHFLSPRWSPPPLESTLTNGASDAWCEWPTYHQPHNPYTPLPLPRHIVHTARWGGERSAFNLWKTWAHRSAVTSNLSSLMLTLNEKWMQLPLFTSLFCFCSVSVFDSWTIKMHNAPSLTGLCLV